MKLFVEVEQEIIDKMKRSGFPDYETYESEMFLFLAFTNNLEDILVSISKQRVVGKFRISVFTNNPIVQRLLALGE